jgi:L-serine kinase (ADP)
MYRIQTESLELQLEMVPVKSLVPHEAVIPHAASDLILEFSNWTNLQNPVIVDKNCMVLDGHHRFFVFKVLNFKYIPVCRIDYLNDATKLRYWFRLLGNASGPGDLRAVIREMNGTLRDVAARADLEEHMREDPFCWGIQGVNSFCIVQFKEDTVYDAVSAYDVLEKCQARLVEKGVELRYVPCQNVTECDTFDELKEGRVVIWTPHISKEMVLEAVKAGRKFAPKATRHLVPARPINVNVPTRWLKEEISLREINRRFVSLLEKKDMKRFGPGQIFNGRYYEEELFVFYDKEE